MKKLENGLVTPDVCNIKRHVILMNMIPFLKESLKKIVKLSDYQQAITLLNKNQIHKLECNESEVYCDCMELTAEVQDGLRRYKVNIELFMPGDEEELSIDSFCDEIEWDCACNEWNFDKCCRHVAAVLLVYQQLLEKDPASFEDNKLLSWLDSFQELQKHESPKVSNTSYGLYFELSLDEQYPKIAPKLYRHLKNGSLGAEKNWSSYDLNNSHFTDEDKECIVALEAHKRLNKQNAYFHHDYYNSCFLLSGIKADKTLEQLLNTGKVHLKANTEHFVSLGPSYELSLHWKELDDKKQTLVCSLPLKKSTLFFAETAWYFDKKTKKIGHLLSSIPSESLKRLLFMPPVPQSKAIKVNAVLANQKGLEALPSLSISETNQALGLPSPHLYFHSLSLKGANGFVEENKTPSVTVSFQYDNVLVAWHDEQTSVSINRGDISETVSRNIPVEASALKLLAKSGLVPLDKTVYGQKNPEHSFEYLFVGHTPFDFWQVVVPQLTEHGWLIQMDEHYEHRLIDESEQEWYADVQDGVTADWFSLDLGIIVQGEKINLLPIIQKILQDLDAKKELAQIKDTVVYAKLPNGYHLPIQGERLYQIMHTLLELFDKKTLSLNNTLSLSKSEAARLIEIEEALGAAQLR